jgi:hypothetical protein
VGDAGGGPGEDGPAGAESVGDAQGDAQGDSGPAGVDEAGGELGRGDAGGGPSAGGEGGLTGGGGLGARGGDGGASGRDAGACAMHRLTWTSTGASRTSRRAPQAVPAPWLGNNTGEYAASSNWPGLTGVEFVGGTE